jgi:hypothetical protein
MHHIKRHLSYPNVTATLALIIAVAGGTTAIARDNAAKNSVASSSIKPFNVTAGDLAGVRVVQVTGQFKSLAPCARRERLLGGGGGAAGGARISAPQGNGWYVEQDSGPLNQPVVAYALCLKAKPGK